MSRVRVLGLEEQEQRDDQVAHEIVDGLPDEHDPIFSSRE